MANRLAKCQRGYSTGFAKLKSHHFIKICVRFHLKLRLATPLLFVFLNSAWAQNQTPQGGAPAASQSPAAAPADGQAPTVPAVPTSQIPDAQQASPQPSAKLAPPKEVASPVNTGSGFSIEPIYWFSNTNVKLRRGGKDFQVDPGDFDYPGSTHKTFQGMVTLPVGKNGALRVSYFQAQKSSGTTATRDLNLFTVEVTKGDPVATQYKIQAIKASYEYLTYFWHRGNSEFRVKTLWELQRVTLDNELEDFFLNADGSYTLNPASGTKNVFLPTFGLGLEQTISKHVRWEAKGSGFGLFHGGAIADAEASVAFRFSHLELIVGDRYFHFKTSAKADHYNLGTLTGPFAGIRYYWKKQ